MVYVNLSLMHVSNQYDRKVNNAFRRIYLLIHLLMCTACSCEQTIIPMPMLNRIHRSVIVLRIILVREPSISDYASLVYEFCSRLRFDFLLFYIYWRFMSIKFDSMVLL